MKKFSQLIQECLERVEEIFPWDLEEKLGQENKPLLIDVREPKEFEAMHIENSINAPRGILETCCEYDFDDTIPELVEARDKEVVVICRSGNRSVFAADVMQQMGYKNVVSLKTGLRGWNDSELPLTSSLIKTINIDEADAFFTPKLKPEQLTPKYSYKQ